MMIPTTVRDAPAGPIPVLPASFDGAAPPGEDDVEPVWHTLGSGGSPDDAAALRPRRLLTQLVTGVVLVLVLVAVAGALAARALAEREAENQAPARAAILAEAVVAPALTRGVLEGRDDAVRRFDRVIRRQVLLGDVVRVKVWDASGQVVYADEPQLVGRTFELDAEKREVLTEGTSHTEISELDASENAFEGADRLVEVYHPIALPGGEPGLFEIYTSYEPVGERTSTLWRGFAAITLASLVGLLLLLLPVLWHLFDRVRRHERQRTRLLQRAVDASAAERRRIAASLHDGPVQELAATSFTVAGAAAQAGHEGSPQLSGQLETAASSVRTSIRSLRTLLTDIYPTALVAGGLGAALDDLAQTASTREVRVTADVEPGAEGRLDGEEQRAVFRLAQESVRNAVRHSGAPEVSLRLAREGDTVVLDVMDAGQGFDVERALAHPEPGHLGLRILGDLAQLPGMTCQVSSCEGCGTHIRVVVERQVPRARG